MATAGFDRATRNIATQSSDYFHRQLAANVKTMTSSFTKAANMLTGDIESILNNFQYKGGFTSRAEAQAWLNQPISQSTIKTLQEQAMKLPEPQRSQMLTRVSSPAYLHRIKQKEALLDSIRINAESLKNSIKGSSQQIFSGVAQESYIRAGYDMTKGTGVAVTTARQSDKAIAAILNKSIPKKYQEYFASDWAKRAQEDILAGVQAGKSIKDMTNSIHDLADDQKYRTTRYVRTFMTAVSSAADDKSMQDAGFESYRFVATLDEVTCPICGEIDGEVFKIDEAEAGENSPPMHFNCRCRKVIVFTDEQLAKSKRVARDENGKPVKVPGNMTYSQYKQKYMNDPITAAQEKVAQEVAPPIEVKPSVFESVTDHKQLVDEMQKTLGFKEVDAIKNMDLEIMKKSMAQLDKIMDDYPELRGAMSEFNTFSSTKGTVARVSASYKEGAGEGVDITLKFQINKKQYVSGNSDEFYYQLDRSAKSNFTIGNTAESVVSHEAGHMLHGLALQKKYPKSAVTQFKNYHNLSAEIVDEAIRKVQALPQYQGMSANEIMTDLSRYAAYSKNETLAEAVSDVYTNGTNAKPLSTEIVAILNRLLK